MNRQKEFSGVFAAAVTPFDQDDAVHVKNLCLLVRALIGDGVDGILLTGTTGEGPMLSLKEGELVIGTALDAAGGSGIKVLAGTGCVSIKDTIDATRRAFELGVDGVVLLPPYYFKKISMQGLLDYYNRVFDQAVPDDGHAFLYDIPQITSIPMADDLFEGLLKRQAGRFCGVKDSIGDFDHTSDLIRRFPELHIMAGTDKLLLRGLQAGAAGCITAGTNVLASYASRVYRSYLDGLEEAASLQVTLTAARTVLEGYMPFPVGLKSLLALRFRSSGWHVRLPLLPLDEARRTALVRALKDLHLDDSFSWLDAS